MDAAENWLRKKCTVIRHGGMAGRVFPEKPDTGFGVGNPEQIPWVQTGVVFFKSTGVFNYKDKDKAAAHFKGGTRKAVIVAPRENALMAVGVNEKESKSDIYIDSNASCSFWDAICPHFACSTLPMPTDGASGSSTSGALFNCWILDSGATRHMTHDSSLLSRSRSYSLPIITANGFRLEAKQIGSIDSPSLSVHDVLLVPGLALNILSVAQISDAGYGVYFLPTGFVVRDLQSKKIVGSGGRMGRLYVVDSLHIPPSDISFPEPTSPGPSVSLSYVPNTTTFASQDVDLVSFENTDPVRLQFNASSSEIKAAMKEEFDTEDYVVSSGFIGDASVGIALNENFVKRLP